MLVAIPRLQELGVATKRPDDFFAEMAKPDWHMKKVTLVAHPRLLLTQ